LWPFNSHRKWGWWPSSIFSFLLFIFVVALMLDII
jgi:hypothetical protein